MLCCVVFFFYLTIHWHSYHRDEEKATKIGFLFILIDFKNLMITNTITNHNINNTGSDRGATRQKEREREGEKAREKEREKHKLN